MKTPQQTIDCSIYIGFDPREKVAADVCEYSLRKRATSPIHIELLKSSNIPAYDRPVDVQSTDFTYTRFFIPYLQKYKGMSMFCDCDFLFLTDITELFNQIDRTKAVSVVKHPTYIPHTALKMDGIQQHAMARKNWASLIIFNNEHPANAALTPEYINTITPGRLLHQFDWLEDNMIGSIPLNWNVLDDYYLIDDPKAIHYTDGGPWFANYRTTTYSNLWLREYTELQINENI